MLSPSASEKRETFSLTVESDNAAAEIFLLDHQMKLIDRAIGSLHTQRPDGVYKVKLRLGRETQEHMVLLDRDIELRPTLTFASPAPLNGSSRTHELHIAAAQNESTRVHVHRGSGASIFMLARYWTSPGYQDAIRFPHPGRGVQLVTATGDLIADLETDSVSDPRGDAWAACTVELDRGAYLLRSSLGDGNVREQTIIACSGWQSQVFLLRRAEPIIATDEGTQSAPREPSASLSVFMSRGGFDYRRPENALTEVTRLALADERFVLSSQLRDILVGKFENPMLGIFGAHLLLLGLVRRSRRDPRRDVTLQSRLDSVLQGIQFDGIVENLRSLVGERHPDVDALSLKCADPGRWARGTVTVPPMLRASWSLLVEASNDDLDLVPLELWDRVQHMTAEQPFFTWFRERTSDAPPIEQILRSAARPRATGSSSDVLPLKAAAPDADPDLCRRLSLKYDLPRPVVERALSPALAVKTVSS